MTKRLVTLQIDAVQDDERTTMVRPGTCHERDGATYVLYDDEGTATTLRLTPDAVRIYRRGVIESWQDFQVGELTNGSLAVGATLMVLSVRTTVLLVTPGRLDLQYELFTAESNDPDADPTALSLGTFTLAIAWRDALPEETPC